VLSLIMLRSTSIFFGSLFFVSPAILLHDVGFLYDPDPYSHHLIGGEKSHTWLTDWSAAVFDPFLPFECTKPQRQFPEWSGHKHLGPV
jgi:hypothetical protein